uniref:Xyloglucan endotransglycosylase/hydrolase protein 8 n=1 Tax=Aegilops tauschii TaxID=37682 RepID=N1QPH6_AEGTA
MTHDHHRVGSLRNRWCSTPTCVVWGNDDGKKEHQLDLWFDPAADYHTYTTIWNDKNLLYIRSFRRYADLAYPSAKPMSVHATLWDGSYWATQKGKVPVDWSGAPFVVSYRAYSADACGLPARGRRGRQPALLPRWHRPLDEPAARRRRARHRRMGQARATTCATTAATTAGDSRRASPPSAPAAEQLN